MGENKGHGNKAPNYPDIDEGNLANNRAGSDVGNQQSAGKQPSAGKQQDIGKQQGTQQGSQQSIGQQSGRKQDSDLQQGSGSQQSAGGQRQNQQKGGQHASGGTPALDDLNADLDSRNRGSLGNAAQQMDQTSGWDGKQDKKR